MLHYEKCSLFDAPKGSYIIHACNARGVWGRGIAKDFKEKYPLAFEKYNTDCKIYSETVFRTGRANYSSVEENGHKVGWIITSDGYAKDLDSVEDIKIATTLAIENFCLWITDNDESPIVYSNKFNSGLFRVPWEDSARILKKVLSRYPQIEWVVCDPSGDFEKGLTFLPPEDWT